MAGYKSYVICTSPRSGSTLLCTLLAATGIAGNPDSHFHRTSIPDWMADLGLAPDPSAPEVELLKSVFRAAIAEGTRGTGIFGLRLQRQSFDFFTSKLAALFPEHASDADRFRAAFGRTLFVHLTRRDKVEQAVSYVRAQQSGLWHIAPDGSELERLGPPQDLAYDADVLRTRFAEMVTYDRDWDRWFADQGINPLRITYEALSIAPTETLGTVLDRLGLGRGAASGVKPGVAKLADSLSRNWAARFRSECGVT